MYNETRALRRINNKYGVELIAKIYTKSESFSAEVLSYNSFGVLIKLSSHDFFTLQRTIITGLQLHYGEIQICEVQNPILVRYNDEGYTVILKLRSSLASDTKRSERAALNFDMQGFISGIDPFTFNQSLVFRLVSLSKTGFAVISSKSNRHLTPGLVLKNFTVCIPEQPSHKISFVITNITDEGQFMKMGCRFLSVSKKLEKEIERTMVINNKFITTVEVDDLLKARIKRIKSFGNKIRIRRVETQEEYENVLRLRFLAYKEADKVQNGQTWQSMADEFDETSLIYVAYIGQTLAGTIRLVFPNKDNRLPFQSIMTEKLYMDLKIETGAEISKFAIDPHLQGTDIFLEMFKSMVYEIGAKSIRYPICLSTKKLSKYYKGIGAVEISDPVPHPTISNETLTLFYFDPVAMLDGKMSALGWFFVVRPVVKLLRNYNIVRRPKTDPLIYLKIPFELIWFSFKKYLPRFIYGKPKSATISKKVA